MSDINIKCLQFDELDQAPEAPGIYAWYASIDIGAADWRAEIDPESGTDFGQTRLRSALLNHSGKYSQQPLSLVAQGTFSDCWRGSISPTYPEVLENLLLGLPKSETNSATAENFHKAFKNQDSRQMIAQALDKTLPFFSSPLYIGVAKKSIKNRLNQHKNKIIGFYEKLEANPLLRDQLWEDISTKESNFAARVVMQNFSPSQLSVYICDFGLISDEKKASFDVESIAVTLEWLLNRWHRPILGRT